MGEFTGQSMKVVVFIIFIGMIISFFKINSEDEYIKGDIASILSVSIVILGLIVFFAIIEFDLTPITDRRVQKIVNIEAFGGKIKSFEEKYGTAFCDSHTGDSAKLDKSCEILTKDNCLATSCCVYAKMSGKELCRAGDVGGPTFKRNENGKTKDIDYYWYKNKCYGKECPDNQ